MSTSENENTLMDALVQTSFLIMAILNTVGAEEDLSTSQIRMLGILRDREPRMAELADHMGLDRSSTSGLIDRAEKRDLVRRSADPEDGRTVRVSLTAKGKRLTTAAEHRIRGQVTQFADTLSASERRRLASLLSQIIAADTTA